MSEPSDPVDSDLREDDPPLAGEPCEWFGLDLNDSDDWHFEP